MEYDYYPMRRVDKSNKIFGGTVWCIQVKQSLIKFAFVNVNFTGYLRDNLRSHDMDLDSLCGVCCHESDAAELAVSSLSNR